MNHHATWSSPPRPVHHSRFVNLIGLSFAAVSGGMAAVSAVQLVVLWLLFPPNPGGVRERMAERLADAPWPVSFIAARPDLWLVGLALASSLTLLASLGLLRRRTWGRRLFIAMILALIGWIGVALPALVKIAPHQFGFTNDVQLDGQSPFVLIRVFTILGLVVLLVICLAIVLRLCSPSIRLEFD